MRESLLIRAITILRPRVNIALFKLLEGSKIKLTYTEIVRLAKIF